MKATDKLWKRIGDMTWPVPGPVMDDLEYALRYNRDPVLSMETRLAAASIISAYGQLILNPKEKRDQLIRELRK